MLVVVLDVVELVVVDDELLEVVVVVPSKQSTYASSSIYVPGSVGADPQTQPSPSHEFTYKTHAEPFHVYMHKPPHAIIHPRQSRLC